MLGSSYPAPATISTTNSSATPTSPSRPSRLRGLSYLRNYTHNHLHSNSNSSSTPRSPHTVGTPLARSRSSPGRESPATRAIDSQPSNRDNPAPSPQRSATAGGPTTGWVPVAAEGGLRSVTDTQNVAAEPSRAASGQTSPMARARAATAVERSLETNVTSDGNNVTSETTQPESGNAVPTTTSEKKDNMPTIRFIPHQEPRATRPSLTFPIVNRTLNTSSAIVRVGRYSERDNNNPSDALTNPLSNAPVGFKSKVVSRRHCEFWCQGSQWYVRDVKSSSGTFLNHVRLSSPGSESRPYPVNDGDIVQLGIDFKGGEEIIFRCVKIRIECNRGWQKTPNPFNQQTHNRLRNLAKTGGKSKDSDAQSVNSSECSICLNAVAPCQALFVAPCSHVWHYKCIRALLYPNWPSFQCPNCRAYADLEADVEQPEFDDTDDDISDAIAASEAEATGNTTSSQTPQKPAAGTTNGTKNGQLSEDELSSMMTSTSLHSGTPERSDISTTGASRSSSRPVPIATPSRPADGDGTDTMGPRSATPTSTAQFSLAAGLGNMLAEGPQTPRNDEGPFLLHTGSGRSGRATREIDDVARDVVGEAEEGQR